MKTEYEVRILEVNQKDIISKLESLGAVKEGDYFQKRYVYNTKPEKENQWIRLRTNGIKTTLTYKNIESITIDGTKELEVEVSSFEDTKKMLEILGYIPKGFQENKRIRYILDEVEIDIDTWPKIPTYVEIEGKGEEEVLSIVDKLEIDRAFITALDVEGIYEKYGYTLDEIQNLSFE